MSFCLLVKDVIILCLQLKTQDTDISHISAVLFNDKLLIAHSINFLNLLIWYLWKPENILFYVDIKVFIQS